MEQPKISHSDELEEFFKEWVKIWSIEESEIDSCRFTAFQMKEFALAYRNHQAKKNKKA